MKCRRLALYGHIDSTNQDQPTQPALGLVLRAGFVYVEIAEEDGCRGTGGIVTPGPHAGGVLASEGE